MIVEYYHILGGLEVDHSFPVSFGKGCLLSVTHEINHYFSSGSEPWTDEMFSEWLHIAMYNVTVKTLP